MPVLFYFQTALSIVTPGLDLRLGLDWNQVAWQEETAAAAMADYIITSSASV